MSSKRGRKRNDNLPPNRARDVQRAFRARRAAHLEALENRVAELEEENNTLRAALSLPPANRPALGKGPTGKDKPKPYAPRSQVSTQPVASSSTAMLANGLPPLTALPLPPSSRTESPSSTSTRTHSMSPSSIAATLNGQQSVVPVDSAPWEDGIFGTRERTDIQPSPVTTSYPATPLSATCSTPYQFPQTAAQIRPYMSAQNLSHTAQDRPPLTDAYPDANIMYDGRQFSYTQSAFPSNSDGSRNQMHAQSPTTSISMTPQRGNPNIQPPINYAHKRSVTEPSGGDALRTILLGNQTIPSISHLQQQHSPGGVPRGPSPPNMGESIGILRAADFELDGRGGRMSSMPS